MDLNERFEELNKFSDTALWRICYLGYDFCQGENWPRTFKQYQEMTECEWEGLKDECPTLHQYLVELAWTYLYEEI